MTQITILCQPRTPFRGLISQVFCNSHGSDLFSIFTRCKISEESMPLFTVRTVGALLYQGSGTNFIKLQKVSIRIGKLNDRFENFRVLPDGRQQVPAGRAVTQLVKHHIIHIFFQQVIDQRHIIKGVGITHGIPVGMQVEQLRFPRAYGCSLRGLFANRLRDIKKVLISREDRASWMQRPTL